MSTTELKNELKKHLPEWRDMTTCNRHGELLETIAYFFVCHCQDAGDNDRLTFYQELYLMLRQLNGLHMVRGSLSCPLAFVRNTLYEQMMQLIKVHFGQCIFDLVKTAF